MKATTRFRAVVLGATVATSLLVTSCGGSGATEDTAEPPLDTTPTTTIAPREGSIMEFIATRPEYSVLTSLVREAGLDEELSTAKELTLFAPSDTVFNTMSATTLDALRKDPEKLKTLLLNHVLDLEWMSIDFLDGRVDMKSGKSVDVKLGDPMTVNGFPVVKADMRVSNGVIHEIAGVITD